MCTSNRRMGWTLLPHCPCKNFLSNQGRQLLQREAEPRRASWAHQPWGKCILCLASFVSLSYFWHDIFDIHLMLYPRTSWQDRSLGEQSLPLRITRHQKGCFCALSNIHHWFCRNQWDPEQISLHSLDGFRWRWQPPGSQWQRMRNWIPRIHPDPMRGPPSWSGSNPRTLSLALISGSTRASGWTSQAWG